MSNRANKQKQLLLEEANKLFEERPDMDLIKEFICIMDRPLNGYG